ncbi:MAG: hypothetical protein NVS4B8_00970 [Herpetosiphon sp.]
MQYQLLSRRHVGVVNQRRLKGTTPAVDAPGLAANEMKNRLACYEMFLNNAVNIARLYCAVPHTIRIYKHVRS